MKNVRARHFEFLNNQVIIGNKQETTFIVQMFKCPLTKNCYVRYHFINTIMPVTNPMKITEKRRLSFKILIGRQCSTLRYKRNF